MGTGCTKRPKLRTMMHGAEIMEARLNMTRVLQGGRCQQGIEKMLMETYQKTVSGHWLMDMTLLRRVTQPLECIALLYSEGNDATQVATTFSADTVRKTMEAL